MRNGTFVQNVHCPAFCSPHMSQRDGCRRIVKVGSCSSRRRISRRSLDILPCRSRRDLPSPLAPRPPLLGYPPLSLHVLLALGEELAGGADLGGSGRSGNGGSRNGGSRNGGREWRSGMESREWREAERSRYLHGIRHIIFFRLHIDDHRKCAGMLSDDTTNLPRVEASPSTSSPVYSICCVK
jgi:hypothetical protein